MIFHRLSLNAVTNVLRELIFIANSADFYHPIPRKASLEAKPSLSELIEVKADRQSVGSSTKPFKNHSIRLQNGDCLYLFSDGYCDQFGGPEEKKFSKKRLRELLLSMAHEGMTVQREQLVKRHLEWKGNRPQVDDICVIGVRVIRFNFLFQFIYGEPTISDGVSV